MSLPDRFIVATDPDAPPSNWDVTLAKFLLRYIRSRPADAPATDAGSQHPAGAEDE